MAHKCCTFARKNYAGDERANKLIAWGMRF